MIIICGVLVVSFLLSITVLASAREEMNVAAQVHQRLVAIQPVPTDIVASYERHNIIKRSYWVNGLRNVANNLVFPGADIPVAYIILYAPNGQIAGRFPVLGKATSLNYSLVPYSESWHMIGVGDNGHNFRSRWIPNAGGVFGTNTEGIFWFTPCGRYMEWNGYYTFSDVPFHTDTPMIDINNLDASGYN